MPSIHRTPKPQAVTAALLILSTSAVLGSAEYIYRLATLGRPLAFVLATAAVVLAATSVVLYALFAGHGWVRLVVLWSLGLSLPRPLLALIVTTPAVSARLPIDLPTVTFEARAFAVGKVIVSIVVMGLLLSRSAREWYQQPR